MLEYFAALWASPSVFSLPPKELSIGCYRALRTRRTFASLKPAVDLPNLIDIQRRSFEWLTEPEKGGLRETIDDISPITDYTGNLAIQFGECASTSRPRRSTSAVRRT